MTPVYPTTKVYIDFDNDNIPETNISLRVASNIEFQHGTTSYKDTERVANVGSVSFTISDINDEYNDFVVGYIGRAIKITLTLGGVEKQIFFGYINSSDIESSQTEQSANQVKITATDWMNIANKARVGKIALAQFVTADKAIPTLLSATTNPPAYTDLDNGFERFENMFDGALQRTTVYSELDKITKSELGYLYLKFRPNANRETLRFENYLARGSRKILSRVPKDIVTPFFLKYHGNAGASGYLKYHGNAGASGKIKLSQAQNGAFDRTMVDSDWEAGNNVINQMSVNNIPRKTDTSLVVLYNISSPIEIGTSQVFIINGSFSDPNGGTLIQAKQVTFADTDWTFNSASDGTGTDLKPAGGIQVNFNSGTNSFSATFTNSGVVGFLTSFQVRGKGIYKYSQIETLRENLQSQTDLKNIYSDSITREYSNDYDVSKTFADAILSINRTPIRVMKSATFIANTSEHLMLAFMYLEQGDKVQIVESSPAHTGDYYIQGIKATITQGGIVNFTWYLKEDIETVCQPIAVRCGTNNAGNRSAIDFGILPYLANLERFSYSLWVKRLDTQTFSALISRAADDGVSGRRGNLFLINTNGDLNFQSYKTPTDGEWKWVLALTSTNTWAHVVLTYDNTKDTADPELWVDGALKTITEVVTPSGKSDDDSDMPLILFNVGPNPAVPGQRYFYDTLHDIAIKDVRIYNHILSSAEITELGAGQNNYTTAQNGLLFNGIYAPRDNIDNYINNRVLEHKLLLDSVYRAAGNPYNEDVSADTETLYGLSLL